MFLPVDVTPPQAATKIMAGMVEQQTEWRNGGMAEWRNGGMAGWRNGRMAEWRNGGMAEWRNGRRNGGMAEMAEMQKKWQNDRMTEMATYVLFMVHSDDTDDNTNTF